MVQIGDAQRSSTVSRKAAPRADVEIIYTPVDEKIHLKVIVMSIGECQVDISVLVEVPQVDQAHFSRGRHIGIGPAIRKRTPAEITEGRNRPNSRISFRMRE